jgi:short-subunit dehydrogenase
MKPQIACITGAGSGLGATLAQQLSEKGYHICLTGRNTDKLDRIASTLQGDFSIYALDVSSHEQVTKVFNKVKEEHGQLDLLINNAGVGVFDLTESLTEDNVHQMIDINLKGTIFCTQAVVNEMKQRNQGTIVNIVSTAGLEGKVTESVYCASKFGVRGFTESLQLELEDTEIRISGVYMGGMNTNFWDGILDEDITNQLMDPKDIAGIILANIAQRKHINVSDVVIKNKDN